ncbi:lasso peptide biosynthesis PqqD family chaperone [Paenibacillus sp. BR1-192]|uniref:lasso peptide biosynthesis PqqD family chaperone n=1 Tax=Paenibacillus sp. BR1-192 TaxID=3032287 RepID=UPI00240E4F1E|nr:lasso peptide biosynthesis PqqD family chaperone [Paenibacillus sp. BR1-192]WFB58925.1 lasso peptide biosynthesis PqqD family chaperone [Paenibacillus sp. BR1-192]
MSTELITTDALVVQSEGFLVSDMDGEKVMLSIENGKYYNLGRIGGRIWELISSPATISNMVDQLILEYEIEPELCEQQVRLFLKQLAAEGLVQVDK